MKLLGFLLAELVRSQAAGVRIGWHTWRARRAGRALARARRRARYHQAALVVEARLAQDAVAELDRRGLGLSN